MRIVSQHIVISADLPIVWAVVADIGSAAIWNRSAATFRILTEGRGGGGTKWRIDYDDGEYTVEEIVEWDPPIAWFCGWPKPTCATSLWGQAYPACHTSGRLRRSDHGFHTQARVVIGDTGIGRSWEPYKAVQTTAYLPPASLLSAESVRLLLIPKL
ncbi:MAG: SRPBCC family protein [Candidatus Binatia bacterium]